MQLASSARIPDGFMAAMRLGGEKPHQGLPGRNPALYQGPTVSNSTTALGLRGQAELNRVGSCSTGKERDQESGNDYFGARYYASTMGRFMSPDWSAQIAPVPYAKLDNPQTLNLYAYVGNNPLARVDADGHASCDRCAEIMAKMAAGEDPSDALAEVHGAAQQQSSNSSSNGRGFWSHVGNLLHGHSWNYGMRESVTMTIRAAEPNPLITAGTDAAGVIAPFAGKAENALGVAGSIISVANDHSPKNLVMTGLPFFVRKLGLPLAIAGAAEDAAEAGSEFITDHIMAPIFNAAPSQTIDDGSGHSMPNPGLVNECQALGGNGC